eukprot:263121-Chlamydomonas_euryale.AAC.2
MAAPPVTPGSARAGRIRRGGGAHTSAQRMAALSCHTRDTALSFPNRITTTVRGLHLPCISCRRAHCSPTLARNPSQQFRPLVGRREADAGSAWRSRGKGRGREAGGRIHAQGRTCLREPVSRAFLVADAARVCQVPDTPGARHAHGQARDCRRDAAAHAHCVCGHARRGRRDPQPGVRARVHAYAHRRVGAHAWVCTRACACVRACACAFVRSSRACVGRGRAQGKGAIWHALFGMRHATHMRTSPRPPLRCECAPANALQNTFVPVLPSTPAPPPGALPAAAACAAPLDLIRL